MQVYVRIYGLLTDRKSDIDISMVHVKLIGYFVDNEDEVFLEAFGREWTDITKENHVTVLSELVDRYFLSHLD